MVYVLSKSGKPLMPTKRHGKVRHLLEDGKAKVIHRTPFTIQLLYDTTDYTNPVDLGVDVGSKTIGLSACTNKEEVFAAEVTVRNDIHQKLEARRTLRRSRRSRKTRYRKPRFLNRTRPKGWLAPSVKAKCATHINIIQKVMAILPISNITIEMAPFDTQLLKAQLEGKNLPKGCDYKHGEAEGFDNIKAYVKWRDGYKCRVCGKEHVKLQVHHKKQRKDGGSNRPDNLVTVCETCHKAYHAGKLSDKKAMVMQPDTEVKALNDAAFMSIMRWTVWNKLKTLGVPIHMTYGYITAKQREKYGIVKTHHADARCISGHGDVKSAAEWFAIKKVRCHNRQIHKANPQKGGKRKPHQAPFEVRGYRLNDVVSYSGQLWFVHGRRQKGAFVLQNLCGLKLETTPRKLKYISHTGSYLIERRVA